MEIMTAPIHRIAVRVRSFHSCKPTEQCVAQRNISVKVGHDRVGVEETLREEVETVFDFHAACVFSESQAGFEAEPTWLPPSSQLTRQRDLAKRWSLVQTRNPVLTHGAQLLQIPPFPVGIQPSPPPGTKTKPSLHQGLGE